MKINKNERIVLKKYLESITICICGFISEDEIKICIEKSNTIPELFEYVSNYLKTKEKSGWQGEDLTEEQLNVLTIISELYLKRNKSKYKSIEKPSEILFWFSNLLKISLSRSELKMREVLL